MSEKTEQPTPKRLREAREKGDVPKSPEVASALVVLVVVVYFLLRGEDLFRIVTEMAAGVFAQMDRPFDEALSRAAGYVIEGSLSILAPLVILAVAASLLANLGQVGVLFAFKGALPKMENLSPGRWFKKTFSKKNALELVKNFLKVGVLSGAVWLVLKDRFRELFVIPERDLDAMWTVLTGACLDLALHAAVAFSVLAAVDYVFTRFRYTKEHMMTKDEVKREYKDMEGDPLIKSRRRQLHQEMANQDTLGRVRKAKVLVVNPTHVAVALDYDRDRTPLPVVLAKGEDHLARRMITVAREEGIPILRQASLARQLYEDGQEDASIPKNLLAPVAEVLRWVQSLREQR